MNQKLTDAIINHIFDNLGLTLSTSLSLRSHQFLTRYVIDFTDDDLSEKTAKVWGSKIKVNSSELKIILADFSDVDSEYAAVIKLDENPSYGCYLCVDSATNQPYDGLIACYPKHWAPTTIGMQADLLSGMENLKDIFAPWEALNTDPQLFTELKLFINYQNNLV